MTSELQEETTADAEELATNAQDEPTATLEGASSPEKTDAIVVESDTEGTIDGALQNGEKPQSPNADEASNEKDDIGDLLADVFEEESSSNEDVTRLATILPEVAIDDVTAIVRGIASKMGL